MHGKIPIRTASLIVAILGWLLVTALAAFIIWSLRDRARIIRDKDNEQIINILFASLRGYDDFGVAIEANPLLKERITGFAMYNVDFSPIYRWGDTPAVFDERLLGNRTRTPHKNDFFELRSFGRYISSSPGERSTRVVFHTDRLIPRMPPLLSEDDRPEDNKQYGYPNRETETYGHPTMGTETLGLSAGTETYGLPSAGTETYGLPTTGTETLGLSAGTETYGLPTMGTETLGLSAGTETYGLSTTGTETYGLLSAGTETYGLPSAGTETYGLPTMGTETYGLSSAGTETYGHPTTGTETLGLSAGTETYGLPTMGTETLGLSAGTETYGLSSAGTEADIGMQLQKVRSRLSGAEKGAQRVIT
ncbi:MAG: hypothetical protein LBF87_03180, partial [Treponema sp.]|nr:hypothetical protein [Treponema sp.]